MRKILFSVLFGLILSSSQLIADNVKSPLNESGVYLNGKCKAIASSPNGYVYVLTRDKKLICIDYDGEQKEIPVPLNKEIKSEDDYFCDMSVDTKTAYFCAYNYSSILALDINNPKELKVLKLSYNGKPINPMMISRTTDGWCVKDFDFRTFKVDKSGNMTLLPDHSEVILDKDGKPVILEQPKANPDGTTVFPNKVFSENNSIKWIAPAPLDSTKKVTNIEYLGYNSDRGLDIYLVTSASGELDGENTIYAIDSNNKIVCQRILPYPSLDFLMRYCKLSSDGSVIAVYANHENPDGQFIIKKYELKEGIEAPQKG